MDHKVGELADSLAAAAQDARSLDRQVSFVRAPVATRKWPPRTTTHPGANAAIRSPKSQLWQFGET